VRKTRAFFRLRNGRSAKNFAHFCPPIPLTI
jgi:hypothetical protein